jgi:hypothetical protein
MKCRKPAQPKASRLPIGQRRTLINIGSVLIRFWPHTKVRNGYELEPEAKAALEGEHSKIKVALLASYTAL